MATLRSLVLRSGPPETAATLLDQMGDAHRQLLRSAKLPETSPEPLRRLRVLQELYVDRKVGTEIAPKHGTRLFADQVARLGRRRLGPVAA